MDEEDSQVPIWSYRVNLNKRVRDDHPLRRIRAALDLSFVRKEIAHTYGRRGNKSVPPEVIVVTSGSPLNVQIFTNGGVTPNKGTSVGQIGAVNSLTFFQQAKVSLTAEALKPV